MVKKRVSVKINEYFESEKREAIPNLHRLKFMVAFLLVNAVSTHFLLQTIRSIIIAPQILEELIPILAGLLLAPFVVLLLTMFLDTMFIGLLGMVSQVLGRAFLLVPSDPDNYLYNTGMIVSILGQALLFTGILGFLLKDVRLKEPLDDLVREKSTSIFTFGLMLGVAMNLILRTPGFQLSENVAMNACLIAILVAATITWSHGVERNHRIVKNLDQTEKFEKGKGKKFSKALHLLMLGPIIGILSYHFNRPEMLSSVSLVGYNTTAYVVIMALLAGPLAHHLLKSLDDKIKKWVKSITSVACYLVLGLMYYMPRGLHLLLFVVVLPFSSCYIMEDVFRLARRARVNNIDVAIVFSWTVVILSIVGTLMLSLLYFLPYVQLIIFLIPVAYVVLNFLNIFLRRRA